jgi:DNA-binding LacI/PurR family transcriptional regulator
MATGLKDIARAAKVSCSTVSRALSGSPLVNPETAARIKRIAEASNYTVSALGRGLVTGKSNTIGVVVTTIADPFVGEVVSGVEEIANQNGFTVILACSQANPEREMAVVRSFEARRVEGILVAASRVGAMYLPMMSARSVPIVLLNDFHPGRFTHSVMIDNVGAAREATAHLIKLGHRRIAYLGDEFGMKSDADRMAGYRKALEEAGIACDPRLVAQGNGKPEGGQRAMRALLALKPRPTAVFCYNDMSALGALRAAGARRVQVPRDLSIVGFDDLFVASYVNPPLTTIRQPMRSMGQQAMKVLLKLLKGEKADAAITVKGRLIVRSSTAPPAV